MSTTTFDPFGETFLADPYPEFARLRTAAPVFWSPVLQYWVVSRYADCKRVLREYTTFSAANTLCASVLAALPARRGARLPARAASGSVPMSNECRPAGPIRGRPRRIANAGSCPGWLRGWRAPSASLVRPPDRGAPASAGAPTSSGPSPGKAAGAGDLRGARGARRRTSPRVKAWGGNRLLFMFGRAGRGPAGPGPRRGWRRSGAIPRSWPPTAQRGRATTSPASSCTPPTPTACCSPSRRPSTILFGLLLAGQEDLPPTCMRNGAAPLPGAALGLGGAVRRPCPDPERDRGGPAYLLPLSIHDGGGARRRPRPAIRGVDVPGAADILLVVIAAANRAPGDVRRARSARHRPGPTPGSTCRSASGQHQPMPGGAARPPRGQGRPSRSRAQRLPEPAPGP